MPARGLSALLPLAALVAGSWLGLDRPDLAALRTAGKKAVSAIAGDPSRLASPGERASVPSVERPPPTPTDLAAGDELTATAPRNLDWPHANPEEKIARAWLLAEGPYHPPGDNHRYVTFTFDDGPFPETTPHVLDLLKEHHVPATFFVIGRYLEGDDARTARARDVVRRAVAEGHLIGNHTYDHRHLPEVARPLALAQIDDCSRIIQEVTGAPPLFFRPPYGDLSRYLEGVMAERKTEVVLWSIEADDMHRDDEKAVAHELRLRLQYAGGGIVLLHDMRWKSVEALDRLLRWLDDNRWDPNHPETVGYDPVDLPEYLRLTAASPQPYETRQALEDARHEAWKLAHPGEVVAAPPPKTAPNKTDAPEKAKPEKGDRPGREARAPATETAI